MIPELIKQSFLNPVGLTALLSLIPVIIFYLVKPKPDQEIMPAMTFFEQQKNNGKADNALSKIKANYLILLHILFVIIAALAIANPLIPELESQDNSVILLDSSASMEDNRREKISFALENLGDKNTLIRFGAQTEILAVNISNGRASELIQEHENTASGTNIKSAVEKAQNYPGKIVIASDMVATGNYPRKSKIVQKISEKRDVNIMNAQHENSHGFIDLEIKNEGEAQYTVKNFENRNKTIQITKPGKNIQTRLTPKNSKEFKVKLRDGRNKIELPSDKMSIDNTLYISSPKQSSIKVRVLGKDKKYFRKAMKTINQTKYVGRNSSESADIYFISQNYNLENNREDILAKINNGSKIILEERAYLPGFSPVKNRTGELNTSIRLKNSLNTQFYSKIVKYDTIAGKPLSSPRDALVISRDEKILFYNVDDEKFGKKLLYPIFWKNILLRMENKRGIKGLNFYIGERYKLNEGFKSTNNSLENRLSLKKPGFYERSHLIAVNYLNSKESELKKVINPKIKERKEIKTKKPARKHLAIFLAFLALSELLILSKKGAI